jgi:ATPase subunit of ABC transporter with duplicated ATPase domains
MRRAYTAWGGTPEKMPRPHESERLYLLVRIHSLAERGAQAEARQPLGAMATRGTSAHCPVLRLTHGQRERHAMAQGR